MAVCRRPVAGAGMGAGNPASTANLRLYSDLSLTELGGQTRLCPARDETSARCLARGQDKIHTIPVRLDDCDVPASFRRYHWANLFEPNGFDRIVTLLA